MNENRVSLYIIQRKGRKPVDILVIIALILPLFYTGIYIIVAYGLRSVDYPFIVVAEQSNNSVRTETVPELHYPVQNTTVIRTAVDIIAEKNELRLALLYIIENKRKCVLKFRKATVDITHTVNYHCKLLSRAAFFSV